MDDFRTALKKSSEIFVEHFQDHVAEVLKGEFEIVEGVTNNRMANILDQLAGIDIWYFNTKYGVRGIANRIQYNANYKTFTIRKNRDSGTKTEFEKRTFAIKNEFLYPVLTLQGYFDTANEKILSYAITYTKDILDMINLDLYSIRKTGFKQIGQAEFYVVSWRDMKALDKKIYVYNGD